MRLDHINIRAVDQEAMRDFLVAKARQNKI